MDQVFNIPTEVSRITKIINDSGFEAYLIGGCVRDLFLGKKPKDWDITTNAKPSDIESLFDETFYENEYGTVGIVNKNIDDPTLKVIEITPYRTEGKYSDKRRPDTVSFDATLNDDLKRRDFTINAIAYDSLKNVVVDPFSGRLDIQKGVIRTVGNPQERFEEDALRILRAVRFHTELGFKISDETIDAIIKNSSSLKEIAQERVRDEFVRIIESDNPAIGIQTMHDLDILRYVVPELEEAIGVEQNQAHAYDVWTHLLRTLQHAADKKYPLHIRLAALLHDISKPKTRKRSENGQDWTFYGHEVVGERVTRKIMQRLKFPTEITDRVSKLVRWHMFFSDTEQITHSAVRRLIANVGRDNVWDLMNVRICDRIGTGRPKENPYRLRKYKAMIEEVMHDPISVSMLAIDGNTIMKELDIPAGPIIGYILHAIFDEVLENPKLNTMEHLLKKARELAKLSLTDLKKLGESGRKAKEEEEKKVLKKIRSKYHVE